MLKSRRLSLISVVLSLLYANSFVLIVTAIVQDFNFNRTNDNRAGEGVTNYGILIRPYMSTDADQTYVLGFASPDSKSFYLSIWLFLPIKNASEVVWVANRNQFVKENATLAFVINGSLTLHDSDGSEVWSTNTDGRGALGVDLNETTGNLRVFGGNNATLWQSFDHPTNVLLQGATLGPGSKLVSNVSPNNFTEGKYSLTMEAGGMALGISVGDSESQPYWMWGYYGLNDSASLSKTCLHPTTLVFTPGILSMVQDNNVTSTGASPDLCNIIVDSHSIFTSTFLTNFPRFLKLDPDGNLRVYVYNGAVNTDYDFLPSSKQCDLPERCGPYGVCNSATGECSGCPVVSDGDIINASEIFTVISGPRDGCGVKGGTAFCNSTREGDDTLLEVTGINYFSNTYNPADSKPSTPSDCKALCKTNCSCTASFFRTDNRSCYLETNPIKTLQGVSDQNLLAFVKVSAAAVVKAQESSNLPLILGLSVPSVCVALLIIGGVILLKINRTKRKSEDDAFLEALPGLPPRFTMKELQVATSGFIHKLGSGGFGTVYEGILPDGTKVAVKKLESAKQGKKEFRAEVATIGSIHHINLVRLRGFCVDAYENILVYEFMPNGSLDTWLFNADSNLQSRKLLPWSVRFKIALGTARGLAYLHEDLRERVIHLDIKPQNILLDEKFVPKVADFGLAKLVDRDHGESVVVTTMRGTPGYLAPEWLLQCGVTDKSDVYSYGMVLLELVAGRRNLDIRSADSQRYLPVWALRELEEGRALDVVDKRLEENFDQEQALRVIHIAFLCIHEDTDMRPTMGTVVQMLEGRTEVPERENLNVSFADVRHCLYSRFLTSIKSESSTSADTDSLELTLLSNMVLSEAR